MKRTLLFGILLLTLACEAGEPKTIKLSPKEQQQAISIYEQRAQNAMDFQAATLKFNQTNDNLNLESQRLCFELKKAHKIPAGSQYQLNEYNGTLEKN